MKRNKAPIEFDPFCFSIIAQKRTLDLKAIDIKTRAKWTRFIKLFLIQRRNNKLQQFEKNYNFSGREEYIEQVPPLKITAIHKYLFEM